MTVSARNCRLSIRNTILVNIVAATMAALCFSGCSLTITPSEASNATSSIAISSDPVSPTPDPAALMLYQITEVNGQLMLIPSADSFQYDRFTAEIPMAYLLSHDGREWEAASYTARKIGGITEKDFRDDKEKTADIYKMDFGSWNCYAIAYSGSFTGSIEEHLIGALVSGNRNDILPRSKDYAIVQYFNDIYAIDRNDDIRRISSHSIPPYDFDTISRLSLPNGFEWYWTYYSVCNSLDNRIYYLTSREQTSYAIWRIDLDAGTESKFCSDLAISIHCNTDEYLSIVMNSFTSDLYGKLLAIDDPTSIESMTNEFYDSTHEFWYSASNWMYRFYGEKLSLDNGSIQISFDPQLGFTPLSLGNDQLWLYFNRNSSITEIMRINLSDNTYSTCPVKAAGTIAEWEELLNRINVDQEPISETDWIIIE